MSWYKCDECGKVFREEDILEIEIQSGECWGTPYTEKGCVSKYTNEYCNNEEGQFFGAFCFAFPFHGKSSNC